MLNNEIISNDTTIEAEVGSNRFKSKNAISNFKKRIITSVIFLIFLVFYISLGALYTLMGKTKDIEITAYFSFLITIVILVASQYEINKATKLDKWYVTGTIIFISLVIFLFPVNSNLYRNLSFYSYLNLSVWVQSWQLPLIIFLFFLIIVVYAALTANKNLKGALINFSTTLIIVLALKAFVIISLSRIDFNDTTIGRFSFNTVVWVWLIIILNDSFAYLGGMRFGKTKLAPKISPKKTWEGAAIGASVSFLFGLTYALVFYFCNQENKPLFEIMSSLGNKSTALEISMYVLLSIAFPFIGLYGDLLFSWVKRVFNIKDFSRLLPGHGGLLDRLDSILFSLFILFILVVVGSSVY
ncbi:phosphatidate cytidylyltransferase [Spiroplasma corruscae]|uniref:Phosphatidate cytidylyltransferase n=1 Tax=Spiroplasma corruscae TaxID=216934 RepID=A0A222ENH8_9MOLU|nr:phosphatidate cytidylyltransferase [Spiroplasma corruscae]ASP28037.1 phosphatidate cytidylyltransferase [Spiroplasma corruscae]